MARPPVLDPVDAAIAAAAEPEPVRMTQLQVTISSTGRPAAVLVPDDATDAELAELAGWLLTQVLMAFRQKRQAPASRIILPS